MNNMQVDLPDGTMKILQQPVDGLDLKVNTKIDL